WAASNTWSWYSNSFGFDYDGSLPGTWYPRVSLMTGGNLFFTSVSDGKCRIFDPDSGALVGPEINRPSDDAYYSNWDFSVISLPYVPEDGYRTRVMAVGGATVEYIELDLSGATPDWQSAGTRQGDAAGKRRRFVCPVY